MKFFDPNELKPRLLDLTLENLKSKLGKKQPL